MEKTKKDCVGCEDNFYNGNNPYGVKECWLYEKAEFVDKLQIHRDQCPPYDKDLATKKLSCYHKKDYVFVKPEVLTSEGYWRS